MAAAAESCSSDTAPVRQSCTVQAQVQPLDLSLPWRRTDVRVYNTEELRGEDCEELEEEQQPLLPTCSSAPCREVSQPGCTAEGDRGPVEAARSWRLGGTTALLGVALAGVALVRVLAPALRPVVAPRARSGRGSAVGLIGVSKSSVTSAASPQGSTGVAAIDVGGDRTNEDAALTTSTSTSTSSSNSSGLPCRDASEGEACFENVAWAMRQGISEHPEWYPGLAVESRFEEFQWQLHVQGVAGCPRPCKDVRAAKRYEGIPGATTDLPGPWDHRHELTFYMYRAQSDADYPTENVNAANLAGVMWYLHNEIVPHMWFSRKYNITRIRRLKVTVKTTWEYFNAHKRQFGAFVAFDNGRCTVPQCNRIWKHFGYIVGCQHQRWQAGAYLASSRTVLGDGCKAPYCNASVWYSLPGPCPDRRYEAKTAGCTEQMPGGRCSAVSGARDCTYKAVEAGEVGLDELAGISNYTEAFLSGKREYSKETDRGVGLDFWNGRHSLSRCARRLDRVKDLFRRKYPHLPDCDALPEPPCDFDRYYKGEFTWPVYPYPRKEAAQTALRLR